MTKIIWKANQVISIETRRKDEKRKSNIYVLAQMVGKAELLIFDMFNTDNDWKEIDLKKTPILFCTTVTRQFIKNSNIFKQNIKGLTNYELPKHKIKPLGIEIGRASCRERV